MGPGFSVWVKFGWESWGLGGIFVRFDFTLRVSMD